MIGSNIYLYMVKTYIYYTRYGCNFNRFYNCSIGVENTTLCYPIIIIYYCQINWRITAITSEMNMCMHCQFHVGVSEWCCLTPPISWREQISFQLDDDDVHFVLDQHAVLYFHSASSLKQQSAGRNVTPFGHIILIPSQPIVALSP